MDGETLAVALALAKKKVLPAADAGDAGSMLVVDSEGKWAMGEPTTATISVSGTKLVITGVE